ncbi:hypothetical protein HDV06_000777 [Boothiomyces sp. JEL0866]|nr:hypothetical protein HDV06_000777 [Boothiomyces sp. JEL0866]
MDDSRLSLATITDDSENFKRKDLTKILGRPSLPNTDRVRLKKGKIGIAKEDTLIDDIVPQKKEKLAIIVKETKLDEEEAKRKDLTKILGKPELPPPAANHEKKQKKKVVIKVKSDTSSISDSEKEIIHKSKDLTKILGAPQEAPDDSHDHREALKIISNYIKEKQEQEANGKKVIKNLVESAKQKLKRAVKKINVQHPEIDSELPSVERRLSLQSQKRELEKQTHSLISVQFISDNIKSFFGETFFVEDSPVKVIDIIRTPTEEWPKLFTSNSSSDLIEGLQFDPHYIRRMSTASEKTVTPETKIEEQSEEQEERKERGIDVDLILERIFKDNEFKRSIMVGQLPNQEVYPELFGEASDVASSIYNEKADDASSIHSFGTQTIGPTFNWSHLSHFRLESHEEDFEPEHPLQRENSEFCDLAELEMLFEKHKKLNRIKRQLHQPVEPAVIESKGERQLKMLKKALDEEGRESLGEWQLKRLNQILDQERRTETKGERQLRQLNDVLKREQEHSYWKPLTRTLSTPFSTLNQKPFHPRHKSITSINNFLSNQDCAEPDSIQEKSWDFIAGHQNGHKEFKKLINYMFKSGKSVHHIETGQEMTVFDKYEYEEIWCRDEDESPSCHSKDEDQASSIITFVILFYFYSTTAIVSTTPINIKITGDRQLTWTGWIRISKEPLSMSDVLEKVVDEPVQAQRFMGNEVEETPVPKVKYKDCFGVLKHKTLFLYTDEKQVECAKVILIPQYKILLHPDTLTDHELFIRHNPIVLMAYDEAMLNMDRELYIYTPTSSEKEDWFIMLRRASKLPAFADSAALSMFYQEVDPVRQHVEAMKKLVANTTSDSEELLATAWLNALVDGDENASFLGDIVIREVDVGNSLPVLSNPKLVNISVDGDMLIEMDIDYTGGVRVEAATQASLSVPAWDAYMKPITVPIVVAVKINKFSARVLFKIKPFWESNRIWFGFYRQPELKLELEVEPIISNKLIKIQMVNQVIERRIKQSLEAYVMLPNMDDLSFWDFEDLNGSPFKSDDFSDGEVEMQSNITLKGPIPNVTTALDSITHEEIEDDEQESMVNASIVGEALESQFQTQARRTRSISKYIENVEKHMQQYKSPNEDWMSSASISNIKQQSKLPNIDEVSQDDLFNVSETSSQTSEKPFTYTDALGNAAYSLGQLSRQYGLDVKAKSVANSVAEYAQPAVSFAQKQTESYKQIVQQQATMVGLSAIEKLGLAPDKEPLSPPPYSSAESVASDSVSATTRTLRPKSSTTWSVLGLEISTSAPASEVNSISSKRRSHHPSISSSFQTLNSANDSDSALPSPTSIGQNTAQSFELDNTLLYYDQGGLRVRQRSKTLDGDATPRHSRSFLAA